MMEGHGQQMGSPNVEQVNKYCRWKEFRDKEILNSNSTHLCTQRGQTISTATKNAAKQQANLEAANNKSDPRGLGCLPASSGIINLGMENKTWERCCDVPAKRIKVECHHDM